MRRTVAEIPGRVAGWKGEHGEQGGKRGSIAGVQEEAAEEEEWAEERPEFQLGRGVETDLRGGSDEHRWDQYTDQPSDFVGAGAGPECISERRRLLLVAGTGATAKHHGEEGDQAEVAREQESGGGCAADGGGIAVG